jgi:hypothetical protein
VTGYDSYNALFRFLLDVKRVQNELHRQWRPTTRRTTREVTKPSTISPSSQGRYNQTPVVVALRANMQFLVDNLQYHLQV